MGFFLGCERVWAPVAPSGGWWETVRVCECVHVQACGWADWWINDFSPRKEKNAIVIAWAVAGKLIKQPNGDYWLETRSWERKTRWRRRFFLGQEANLGLGISSQVLPYLCSEGPRPSRRCSRGSHRTACLCGCTRQAPGSRARWRDTDSRGCVNLDTDKYVVLWWEDWHRIYTHIKAERFSEVFFQRQTKVILK